MLLKKSKLTLYYKAVANQIKSLSTKSILLFIKINLHWYYNCINNVMKTKWFSYVKLKPL